MRRKDREMPKEFAFSVVDKCEWATLAVVGEGGKPYCVPLSIVREEQAIYFHSAMTGYKTDCFKKSGEVCLSCVGDTYRLPDQFTTEYESAIVFGKISNVESEQEKIHALRLLCQRHTPTNMHKFDEEISRSLKRTAVWRIDIEQVFGKRKKYGKDGKELKFGLME